MSNPYAPSNAQAYAQALPGLAMHVRTYATYRELLTFFLKLTFVNAREKSQKDHPMKGKP